MFKLPCSLIAMSLVIGVVQTAPAFQWNAQPTYISDVWQTEDGLPHSVVTSMVQTANGYLWMGTGAGLVRFDGVRYVNVFDNNAPHLEDSYVWTLFEDPEGALWIGSSHGLSRYRDHQFDTFSTEYGLPHSFVRTILQDRQGRLWIGTYGGGVCLFDEEAGCTVYAIEQGLPDLFVNVILEDHSGRIWVGSDTGLSLLTGDGFEPGLKSPDDRDQVKALFEDNTGRLWVGTGSNIFQRMGDGSLVALLANNVELGAVRSILEDGAGQLWVGTEAAGLFRYDSTGIEQYHVGNGLTNNYVRALFEDREGSLWVGTDGGGLNRLKLGRVAVLGRPEGLPNDAINSVLEDEEGGIWFGTNAGLARLHRGNIETWTREDGLVDDRVFSLAQDDEGVLWVGTNGGGVSRFDGRQFSTLSTEHGLPGDVVFSLFTDRQGRCWIGTTQGLAVWENERLRTYPDPDALPAGFPVVIGEDAQGRIWVGTDGGLARESGDGFDHFTVEHGLPDNAIRALHFDGDGMLWIGTRGGLARWDGVEMKSITTQHGLPDKVIYKISEDDRGYLWLNTGRSGLARVSKQALNEVVDGSRNDLDVLVLGRSDGMRSVEGVGGFQPSGIRSADGRLWFLTHRGAVVVDPTKISPDPLPPPVLIEAIVTDGMSRHPHPDGIEIPHKSSRIEFRYTGLSFLDPDRIVFRHKLEGWDVDWIYDQTGGDRRRSREYSRLPPGDYTFYVAAANRDGIWNDQAAAVGIRVPPPWWLTPWAYLGYGLFAAFGIYGIVRWRVWSLERQNEELEALVAARTEEVEKQAERLVEIDRMKSRFFANISHEFRTPLTLILGPLEELISSGTDRMNGDVLRGMKAQGGRLLGLINQLLELAKLDGDGMKLDPVYGDFVGFLQRIVDTFVPLAERNRITYEFQTPIDRLPTFFDPEKLKKVFVNLLSNAFKFTEAGGKIHVALEYDGATVVVRVRDTGAGIPEEDIAYVFDRFYQAEPALSRGQTGSGIGLALAKELVDLHNGTIDVESTVGFGTVFQVQLPLEMGEDEAVDPASADSSHLYASAEEEYEPEDLLPENSDADLQLPLVLIVDDNDAVRAFVHQCLDGRYRVLEASSAVEGFELLRNHEPQLVISDVMMPEMDGFEFCRRLKNDERTSHIPVILLTARASEESALEGLSIGADDYITKPFDAEVLRARAHNLIASRSSLREKFSQEMVLKPLDIVITPADEVFLNRTIETLERFIDDSRLNVDLLADELGMSRRQLQRKLREVTGESPSAFIRNIRLDRAAELLKNNAGTVSEVAYSVGFKKPGHFSELFRKRFGQPPSEYRP